MSGNNQLEKILSKASLLKQLNVALGNLAEIKKQLARMTPKNNNFKSTLNRRRSLGAKVQSIQSQLSQVKIQREQQYYTAFINRAKQVMRPEHFAQIDEFAKTKAKEVAI